MQATHAALLSSGLVEYGHVIVRIAILSSVVVWNIAFFVVCGTRCVVAVVQDCWDHSDKIALLWFSSFYYILYISNTSLFTSFKNGLTVLVLHSNIALPCIDVDWILSYLTDY